jgi:hypothetical protein
MANPPPFALTFSLNVLNHLGIGLYSNIPAVLSEMVANAWDAGATRVDIVIGTDRIIIQDDGVGLSREEVNDQYLRVGYQKRRRLLSIRVGKDNRHVMGRKGIGKLAAFSIANIVRVETIKNDVKSGFVMNLAEIEEGIDRGELQYNPQPIDDNQIQPERGTRITLRDVKQSLLDVEGELRTELARRFSIINGDRNFEIFINDVPISLKDRDYYNKIQFMWYFGDESKKYVDRCPNLLKSIPSNDTVEKVQGYKVSGWIATVGKPKDIADEHHVVSIFAHGKLIQEDILADIQEARIFKQYIIGEIDADFMDDDEEADIVTSDRQRINKNDPRYILLKAFVTREIKKIGNTWDELRPKKPTKGDPEPVQQVPPTPTPPPASAVNGGEDAQSGEPSRAVPPDAPPPSTDSNGSAQPDGASTVPSTTPGQGEPGERLRPPPPPAREAQTTFSAVKEAVENSRLEQAFKDIILYDLEQARLAYYNRAYKACVIMLGAVVEALLLGTLRRPEFMDLMINDASPHGALNGMRGVRNPLYNDRSVFASDLAQRIGFEEYKQLIQHYIPQTQHLGIGDVQRFRNAVHPAKCIQLPDVYGYYGTARALAHLASLEPLANFILAWTP